MPSRILASGGVSTTCCKGLSRTKVRAQACRTKARGISHQKLLLLFLFLAVDFFRMSLKLLVTRSFLWNRFTGNPFTCSNKTLFSMSSKLLGAPGHTTRTRNKKLLVTIIYKWQR